MQRLSVVLLRATLPGLTARLLPAWTLLAAAITQFWTVIDWNGLARGLSELPVPARALLGLLLVAGTNREALKGAVFLPALRPFWRTGMSDQRIGLAMLLPAAMPFGPAMLAAVLWPHLLVAPGWLAAGLWMHLGKGWQVLVGMSLLFLVEYLPESSIFLLVGTIGWLGRRIREGGETPQPAVFAWGRPRSPLGAVLWRDALGFWRTRRWMFLVPGVLAVPSAGLLLGLRRHGLSSEGQEFAAGILLCMVAPFAGTVLGELRTLFGLQMDPATWPLKVGQRLARYAAVAVAVLMPVDMAMATTGPELGPLGWGRHALLGMALVAGAVLLIARARYRPPFQFGAYLLWVGGMGGLLLAGPRAAMGHALGVLVGVGLAGYILEGE